MNRNTFVLVLVALGLVAGTGLAVAAFVGVAPVPLVDPGVAAAGGESKPPALVSFSSGGARCADEFRANSSTSVAGGGANTEVVHARNRSLPGPSYAIGGPTFERVNGSAYELHVPVESTEKSPRECPGVARYEASMRIPAGDDPWTIDVYHDGEHVTRIHGDSDHSGVGGSVSVGEHVRD